MSSESMKLGSESRFTALILFHRYVRHFYSLLREQQLPGQKQEQDLSRTNENRHHLGLVAAACLFLGCKMSEEPRRIRDVINLCNVLGFCECDDSVANKNISQKELIKIKESTEPPLLDEKYWKAKEEVVSIEQLVLRMLQFDTIVCNPHRCVLIVMDTLNFSTGMDKLSDTKRTMEGREKNDSLLTAEQSETVISDAWSLLNEASLDPGGTALVHPVMVLACAAIQVAVDRIAIFWSDNSNEQQIKLPDSWWRALDIKTSEIQRTMSSLRKLVDL